MKQVNRFFTLLVCAVMLLSLCGCGLAARKSGEGMPTPMPASAYNNVQYSAGYAEEAMMEAASYDGDYGFGAVASSAMGSANTSDQESKAQPESPDKIIYSSEVTVETTEFDSAVGKVAGLVEAYGGWIEASSVSGSNYYQKSRGTASTRDASYTLRIPSNRFQTLMDNLSELGNIPYSHIYTENVTSQYYDAEAHLKAYKTQETRLLEMMELAETVEDVIIIEDRLTELRYQIESLQSRLNNWDRRVSYSTVYLSLKEVREYTPETKVDPSYGEELAQALKDGLYNAGQFLKDLLVFLVEVLPVLVILAPIIWLVIFLVRKLISKIHVRRSEKREAKRQKKTAAAAELAGEKETAAENKKE